MKEALVIIFAFFLGSIPTGYLIIKKLKSSDIREYGSGNIGATNVARLAGKKWGILTFAIDFLKGALVIGIAKYVASLSPLAVTLTGVAIIIGNLFSPFLRFKGGKGVATSAGISFMIAPVELLVSLAAYAILTSVTRYSSVGSLTGALLLLILMIITGEPLSEIILALIIIALLVFSHRENIQRLIKGTENKI